MDIALEQDIRRRAYEIWMASGMTDGDAEHHWLRAEHAVRTEAATAKTGSRKKARAKSASPIAPAETKTRSCKAKATVAVKATKPKTQMGPGRRPKAAPLEAML